MNRQKILKASVVAATVVVLTLATALITSAAPTITLTVNPVGTVDRLGVARISGTVSCTTTGNIWSQQGELRQIVGRGAVVSGYFYPPFYGYTCGPTPQSWSAVVVAGNNARFSPGQARVNLSAYGWVCDGYFCNYINSQMSTIIRLKGTPQ